MTTKSILEMYAKMALKPENFIKITLMQIPEPITPKRLWLLYLHTPDLRQHDIFKSFSQFKRTIKYLISEGDVFRGKAFDQPQFKKTGIFSIFYKKESP